VMGYHGGVSGKWFHRHVMGLKERYGPLDQAGLDYAAAVASLWVTYRQASRSLAEVQRKRDVGRGRRPNLQAVERARKRQGLAFASYDQALRHLRELTRERLRAAATVSELVAARVIAKSHTGRGGDALPIAGGRAR
jgi:hypothetical protein